MLIATDFVYVGGANKDACLLTIQPIVFVLGPWWFILAYLIPLVLITVKDQSFFLRGRTVECHFAVHEHSIQLSVHSPPEWT